MTWLITARSQERLDMVKTKLEQRFGVHVVTFAMIRAKQMRRRNSMISPHHKVLRSTISLITQASLTGRIFSTPTGTGKMR